MDDDLTRHYLTLACPYCSDYMEFFDEGVDSEGKSYDLYVCLECGSQINIAQERPNLGPRYPWDPPDGFYAL